MVVTMTVTGAFADQVLKKIDSKADYATVQQTLNYIKERQAEHKEEIKEQKAINKETLKILQRLNLQLILLNEKTEKNNDE